MSVRKSNSKSRLRYRADQEWNCTPRGNGILDHRSGSDAEKESNMYGNSGKFFGGSRRRRSASRVTSKNPSSRFDFVTAAFSRTVIQKSGVRSSSHHYPQTAAAAVDAGGNGGDGGRKGWPWSFQHVLRRKPGKEEDLENGLDALDNNIADSDGIITLDLRKMSDDFEKNGGEPQVAETDPEPDEDGRSLSYKFKKPVPTWVERQRDVVGS